MKSIRPRPKIPVRVYVAQVRIGERKKPGEIYLRTAGLVSGYGEVAKVSPMTQVVYGKDIARRHLYLT